MAPARTKPLSTEASGSDGGGDGRDTHARYSRCPQAGEDDARPEGELDLEQALGAGHAHGRCHVGQGGVDRVEARVGVADDGQQRVAGQGEDGEAGGVLAQPRDRQEQAEEGERGARSG
jgi:hypothetical protein